MTKGHVGFAILLIIEIWGKSLDRPGRAIAVHLEAVSAKMFKLKRVSLVATRDIGVAYHTNYDYIR